MSLLWGAKISNVYGNLKKAPRKVRVEGCWMFFNVQIILWGKGMLDNFLIHKLVILGGTDSPK